MAKGLGRSLKTILDDFENSYREIEIKKKKVSKKDKNSNLNLDNFVRLLNEKYELDVKNEENSLIIDVTSKKKLKKLRKIFDI